MLKEIVLQCPHKDFESIKKVDENGVEYWLARELMPLFAYYEWRNFDQVVQKSVRACVESGQVIGDHFFNVNKMIKTAKTAVRIIKDYKLDRYACYLIAQNGDSKKREIAQAQTYFAIQTRKQELSQYISADQRRLLIREEVKKENKKLFKTAKGADVTKFGSFNDSGYRGLYELSLKDLERVKGVPKGQLLDHAGSTELAANLFHITQTEEKIKNENIRGQDDASRTHFAVGSKVRQTIKEIGGTVPEKLPMEKHIKELKKRNRKPKLIKS